MTKSLVEGWLESYYWYYSVFVLCTPYISEENTVIFFALYSSLHCVCGNLCIIQY